jgi:hypothetical protein
MVLSAGGGKGSKIKTAGRKCPRQDKKRGKIKSITPAPKNVPDAAVTEPEAATQG